MKKWQILLVVLIGYLAIGVGTDVSKHLNQPKPQNLSMTVTNVMVVGIDGGRENQCGRLVKMEGEGAPPANQVSFFPDVPDAPFVIYLDRSNQLVCWGEDYLSNPLHAEFEKKGKLFAGGIYNVTFTVT